MSSINTNANHTFKPVPGTIARLHGWRRPRPGEQPRSGDRRSEEPFQARGRREAQDHHDGLSRHLFPGVRRRRHVSRLLRRCRRHGRGPDLGHQRPAGSRRPSVASSIRRSSTRTTRSHRRTGSCSPSTTRRSPRTSATPESRPRAACGSTTSATRSFRSCRVASPPSAAATVRSGTTSAGSSRGASRTDSTGCRILATSRSPGSPVVGAS